MKKFAVIAVIVTLIIIIGGVFLTSRGQKSDSSASYPLPSNLTYYWGNGCPHCKNVEDFLSTWDKKDKVKIDKKEVWGNAANASELQARYVFCKITNPQEMGVPLLFTPDGKCFSGDTPIIEYLKTL
jgi:glutaredoxin